MQAILNSVFAQDFAEFLRTVLNTVVYPALIVWIGVRIAALLKTHEQVKLEEADAEIDREEGWKLREAVTDEVKFVEQIAKTPAKLYGYASGMSQAQVNELKLKVVHKRLRDRGIDLTPEVETMIEVAVAALPKTGGA